MGENSIYYFLFYFCWLALTVFLSVKSRSTKGCLTFPREKMLFQLIFGVGLAVVLIAAIAALNIAVAGTFSPFPIFVYSHLYGAKNIVLIVSFQLLVSIVEEFFFRGWLLTLQRAKGQSLYIAALTNAFLFGLLHLFTTRSLLSFAISFAIGFIFAFARSKFRHCTVYSLILAHLIYNLSIT